MSGFLLDTNVLSEYAKPRPDPRVHAWLAEVDPQLCFVSVLTFGEIQRGIAALPTSAKRTHLQTWLDDDLRVRFQGHIIPVDEPIADRWGSIMGQADRAGKPLPVIDSLLVASALQRNLVLVTRDSAKFDATGVLLLNPWTS